MTEIFFPDEEEVAIGLFFFSQEKKLRFHANAAKSKKRRSKKMLEERGAFIKERKIKLYFLKASKNQALGLLTRS
jgi:hypothetical protein